MRMAKMTYFDTRTVMAGLVPAIHVWTTAMS
jgi:hypothetical protein